MSNTNYSGQSTLKRLMSLISSKFKNIEQAKQNTITSGAELPSGGIEGDVYIQTIDALPIQNGGTGATTKAAAMQNLGVARYAIESGNKDGWDYVKYSDGTVEIWGIRDVTSANTSTTFGSIYRSSVTYSFPFPFAFASAPACFVDISSPNDWALWVITHKNATTTTTPDIYIGRAASSTGIPVRFYYYARGVLA